MSEASVRKIARPFHTTFPWLPKDPGEAVERIRREEFRGKLPPQTLGKASTAVENSIRYLLDKYNRTGILDPGLRSFYAAKGVPFDTLGRLESGELPMDAASRAARAREMGLDPRMVWTRNDWVNLDRPRKDYRGNLVYAGFSPELADAAAVSSGQVYPLIGPKNIIGMQRVDDATLGNQITNDEFSRRWHQTSEDGLMPPWEATYSDIQSWLDSYASGSEREAARRAAKLQQHFINLNELGSTGDIDSTQSLLRSRAADAFPEKSKLPQWDWAGQWQEKAPHWKLFETTPESGNDNLTPMEGFASALAHDRAKQAGAGGSLVKDEGGVSVAFFGPDNLRHADLALLDPVHAGQPGYMRALPPIVAATAAASQAQGAEMELSDKAMKQSMRAVEQANKDYPNDSDKASRVALGRFLQAGAKPNRSGVPLSEYLSGLDEGPVQTDRGAYARAVDNSLDRPVIAIEAALATNSDPGGLPAKYPNGYMTLREYWGERVAAQEKRSIADYEARHGEVPPEIRNMYAAMSERMMPVFDDVAGVLAGTLKTDNAAINQYANDMRGLVAAHAPGGQFAQLGSRSQSDQDQIDSEYGPQGKFMLTSAGRQNYEAQRLLDLWSATDDNYAPASTMAQVQRGIGGFVSPIYGMMTGNGAGGTDRYGRATGLPRLAGEEWDEMGRMSKPDGKYGYAAEMYYRGASDVPGESSVYTPEGRSKFIGNEMTTPQGLVNSTAMNTDYPMARWFQNVGMRAREIPSTIGNALGGGDENQVLNLRDLRRNAYRTTPVYPDGADPQEFDAISRQIKSADDRMAGYNSAQLGPKFADLYNSTIGQFTGKMGRTYLSPVAEDALELPIEAVSDPVNMALNVVAPGVSAATGYLTGGMKGAGGNLIRSLAKAGKRMGDDVGEEMITQGGIQSSMGSIWDYFSPATTNPLTGNKNPNDADYEEVKDAAAVQANYDKQDAAKRYGRLLNRSN